MKPLTSFAQKQIAFFSQKDVGYHDFLQLAAQPLLFSVDLLYQLWANFRAYRSPSPQAQAPYLVVSDLLLSGLCETVSADHYRLSDDLRQLLSPELPTEVRQEVAFFVKDYALRHQETLTENLQNIYLAWATSVLAPAKMEEQIIQQLQNAENEYQRGTYLSLYFNLLKESGTSDHHLPRISLEYAEEDEVVDVLNIPYWRELEEEVKAVEKTTVYQKIDQMLKETGWEVTNEFNPIGFKKIALRIHSGKFDTKEGIFNIELESPLGPVDYLLIVDGKCNGVVKIADEPSLKSKRLIEQMKTSSTFPLLYESNGNIVYVTNFFDPNPKRRKIFNFHRPEFIKDWLIDYTSTGKTLRSKLLEMSSLNTYGLNSTQIAAIQSLEQSLKENQSKTLIQMIQGSGKTRVIATSIYRLLKQANAKRILFIVDRQSLAEQIEYTFKSFYHNDDKRALSDIYNVKRIREEYVDLNIQVSIITIQQLYLSLKVSQNTTEDNLSEAENQIDHSMISYNPEIPPEVFDFVILNDCHRMMGEHSKQILNYFDSFLIGFTSISDKKSINFFNGNLVYKYNYQQSVADGLHLSYDLYLLTEDISKKSLKSGWFVDYRDHIGDYEHIIDDFDFTHIKQINSIIKAYKDALKEEIYPNRYDKEGNFEVPKTLIFAQTVRQAGEICNIVNEEFAINDKFCQQVTSSLNNDYLKQVIDDFKRSYYPRIVVTVEMLTTGFDMKPLEVLLFLRKVNPLIYKQMKSRGMFKINTEDLQAVSPTAQNKSRFIVVDAVGTTPHYQIQSNIYQNKSIDEYLVPDSDLQWLNFRGVNLENKKLQNCNFQQANFHQISLRGAYLEDSNFQKANLQQANLQFIDLAGCNFEEADLRKANLSISKLEKANLTSALLKGANLAHCTLTQEQFEYAQKQGAILKNVKIIKNN